MSHDEIHSGVRAYYTDKLVQHGETPRGVDWNSDEAQQVRFTQILSLCGVDPKFSLNDIGCGYGALVDRLEAFAGFAGYVGYDIAPKMVTAAQRRYFGRANVRFTAVLDEVPVADYTVASGIFSVKGEVPAERWERYMHDTIAVLAGLSRRGFAFNCLSGFSDSKRMRADLYYADPYAMFDHCRTRYSRNVALLHDYGLYEFTVRVRLS